MKYRIHQSKSSIFLMELIIVILFFALTGAVCLQIFVKARSISERSKAQTHAVMWAENLAEVFLGCEGDAGNIGAVLAREYGLSTPFKPDFVTGSYDFTLDENWTICDASAAVFQVTLYLDCSSPMHVGEATIYDLRDVAPESDKLLYALSVQKYIPRTYEALQDEEGGDN